MASAFAHMDATEKCLAKGWLQEGGVSQSEAARLLKRSKGAILAGLSGLVWPGRPGQASQAGLAWPGQPGRLRRPQQARVGPALPTVKIRSRTVKTRSTHGQDKRGSIVIFHSKWPKKSPGGLAGTEILLFD